MAQIGLKWIKVDNLDRKGPMWTEQDQIEPKQTEGTEQEQSGQNGLNKT